MKAMKSKIIGLAALLMSCNYYSSAKYDTTPAKVKLAKCLSTRATMYGAYWCGWCRKQEQDFGKEAWDTFKKNYVECSVRGSKAERSKCVKDEISYLPFWKFKNGKEVRGYVPLEYLAEISGCD